MDRELERDNQPEQSLNLTWEEPDSQRVSNGKMAEPSSTV